MIPIGDTARQDGGVPVWTILIILLNVYIFCLELVTPNFGAFIAHYALIPAAIDPHNYHTWYPFISMQFLHGGFLHIISNMLFLWVFGDDVEAAFGKFWFPFFYLLAGVLGGLTQYILAPTSTVPMLGASGAIAGVLGAYFALFPSSRIKTLIPIFLVPLIIEIPASIMLVYWFFTQVLNETFAFTGTIASAGGVAYAAHIGGFISGWIIAKVWGPKYSIHSQIAPG